MMSGNLEQFLTEFSRGLDRTMMASNEDLSLRNGIQKTWSMRQCARFLNVGVPYLNKFAKSNPSFPKGNYMGRERVFTISELMNMRVLFASTAKRPYCYLAWRKPEEALPVISFASQKSGTAKSLTAAHFAQYLNLHYGMRVGVMDADPQSTITFYFVGGEGLSTMQAEKKASMVDFAGLFANESSPYTDYTAEELDTFFLKTSWPGVRLVPAHGQTSEGEIQIARLVNERPQGKNFYRYLRDSIERWRDGNRPQTAPNEIVKDGVLDLKKLDQALNETLDCIIIDYQPALTLFQLNNVVASSSLVIPQTMKGFDLVTLSTFVTGLLGMLQYILRNERLNIGSGANLLLPTIVQRSKKQNKELETIEKLLKDCPGQILPVFYLRSDAISNASCLYQSVYEYQAQADMFGQRKGIECFIENADAVNDAIVSRIWPGRERGYAERWMDDFYQERE